MKIFVVDDEKLIRDVVREYLENSGYEVFEANNGFDALKLLLKNHYDLLVLDIMMPQMDGFNMLKNLPADKLIPTIVLSARGEEYDKLTGFDLGIDDYITKPFSPKELLARINAVLSRSGKRHPTIYKYKGIELNYSAHVLKIDGIRKDITPKEYEILIYLIENKGIVLTREQLLSAVWDYNYYGDDRTVDAHIKMLRNNLGKYRNHIITIRGVGYKYVEEEE